VTCNGKKDFLNFASEVGERRAKEERKSRRIIKV
jgi:hypothetical protein